MSIERIMEDHGFRLSAGCSGKASYVKNVRHDGNRAYISVTMPEGEGMPTTLEEPILVTVYDLKTGDALEEGQGFDSVSEYLETVKEA